MSPGATFERVYHEIKRMLAEGELPPGTPIEPALIGKEIAASITPVRDALHRLTGERLVEAPNHNGFRVPLLNEAALRDIYRWNAHLLGVAIRGMRAPGAIIDQPQRPPSTSVAIATETLFSAIARSSGNGEHARAVEQLSDRLAPYRRAEALIFDDIAEEFEGLALSGRRGGRPPLTKVLDRYHRRRARAVSELLAMMVTSA